MRKILWTTLIFALTGCVTHQEVDPCLDSANDYSEFNQCSQQNQRFKTPIADEGANDIKNQEGQLGIRMRRESCQKLGTDDVNLPINCEEIYSLMVQINCLQTIAGNKYPMSLRGKRIEWEIGKQKGASTTDQQGRFVININNANKEKIGNQTLVLTYKGQSYSRKASQFNNPLNISPKGC